MEKRFQITEQQQIKLWEYEIAECDRKIIEAEHYNNEGDRLWYEEKRSWAINKIKLLQGLGA
ncbi:MAG: hypothetical protein K0S39_268 [Paenibacillus sp.]|jgi:hypothetical protein|nr:hypothetical protein [Paenibacillus sp.]